MNRNKLIIQILVSIIVLILVWLAAWGITTSPAKVKWPIRFADQATLLFGASSIALFIFSTMIAILAIFGWQTIKDNVHQRVEAAIQEKLAEMEMELQGRVISVLGHTLGLLSTEPDRLEPLDRDRLREAIQHCQNGYNLLEKRGDKAKFMALNNLVYYSSVHGDSSRSTYLLQEARNLRDAGQKHNAPDLLLTYCRAILQFGSDLREIDEARQIAAALAENNEIPEKQRKEARFYLASFDKKNQNLDCGTNRGHE